MLTTNFLICEFYKKLLKVIRKKIKFEPWNMLNKSQKQMYVSFGLTLAVSLIYCFFVVIKLCPVVVCFIGTTLGIAYLSLLNWLLVLILKSGSFHIHKRCLIFLSEFFSVIRTLMNVSSLFLCTTRLEIYLQAHYFLLTSMN